MNGKMKTRDDIRYMSGLHRLCLAAWLMLGITIALHAQTDYLTRYVATTVKYGGTNYTGSYTNSGLSWASPKSNVQDAINDLRSYMVTNGITSGGKIYVASGTYTPTESTEESGGTTLNLSFKMFSGISVYGGFNADDAETDDANADGTAGRLYAYQKRQLVNYEGTDAGTYFSPSAGGKPVRLKYVSTLSGNLNRNRVSNLEWNDSRQNYTLTYPGNTYHVVFFATNGFDESGRAKPLQESSVLNGFRIQYGYANNNDAVNRYHTAYGGGVYAVDGASVEYCEVSYCTATRNGGAVYCDGGGDISHCFLHTNQAQGMGILYGQGGAVMLDGKGSVSHSYLINNYAREGGAIALTDAEDLGRNNTFHYATSVVSCLVANNTAASEGGGIYANHGGVLNNTGIYRNRCNGTGVIVGGTANGQAANLYAGEATRVYNSTIWGGSLGTSADSRDDIQYATNVKEGQERPLLAYVAISRHDEADWTYTRKKNVFGVADDNVSTSASGNSYRYLALKKPSAETGVMTSVTGSDYLTTYDWQPYFFSAIAVAGVQHRDIPAESGVDLGLPTTVTDIVGDVFTPTATLGPRTAQIETPTPSTAASLISGSLGTGKVYTLYVDPNRTSDLTPDDAGEYLKAGASWDRPLNNLRTALAFFRRVSQGETGLKDADGNDVAWSTSCRYQIVVKEGTLHPTINVGTDILRSSSIWMVDNVSVYGGFDTSLSGTDLDGRNPVSHPSVISGQVMNEGFAYNSATLVQFGNVDGALLDGFCLTLANAASQSNYPADGKGGAIRVRNDKMMYTDASGWHVQDVSDGDRKTMASNKIRNCIVSNCGALDGAAIYIDTENASTTTLENVIAHNNGTNFNSTGNIAQNESYSALTPDGRSHSIIYVGVNSTANISHCDVLRNVGYGIYIDGGTANVTNSLFYANLDKERTETNGFDPNSTQPKAPKLMQPIRKNGTATLAGSNNLFDNTADATCQTVGTAIFDYLFVSDSKTYPRFENSTRNCGITQGGGDITYYGSLTSFMPGNMNPAVNAASYTGDHTSWGIDIIGTTRDYGGLPDIGAVENYDKTNDGKNQPAYGSVIYVRDYNTYNADGSIATADTDISGRDGSSWATAINGNAMYDVTSTTEQWLPQSPKASTISSPITYRIGMSPNHGTSSTVYYAKNTGTYFYSETTPENGDEFILIATGTDNLYYIYDVTKSKYCYYTDTNAGQGKVRLQSSQSGNTTWYLYAYNSNFFIIIPGSLGYTRGANSWNYHGGTGNPLGLYPGWNDGNGKWGFYQKVVVQNGTNGLQYAVNTAWGTMEPKSTNRTETVSQSYLNGTKDIELYYQDIDSKDEVEVWVGSGKYTNSKGYTIRNHVKVFGAFPKEGSPTKNERHPQLNSAIAKSEENKDIEISDYESILQTAFIKPISITSRVLTHPSECRPTEADGGNNENTPQNHSVYEGVEWDGFTLQYGATSAVGGRNGGGGASIYENVVLRNCVIKDNQTLQGVSSRGRGGGIYCDGGVVENCYVLNNYMESNDDHYGGGIYMIKGTMFNTVIAGNSLGTNGTPHGCGIFMESAKFYNNTIVNNTGADAIGMWTASAASADLTMYNTIVMAGSSEILWRQDSSTPTKFVNCFIQTTNEKKTSGNNKIDDTYDEDSECRVYFEKEASEVNPFVKDYADAVSTYDFRIMQKGVYNCVNAGTPDIGNAVLPSVDMDYTDRIQDCTVDIGAYEYNGAYSITPDVESKSGAAYYYVTQNGFGTSSATNPANAACWQKLQKVLDAAGRYKYLNPNVQVVVKLAAFPGAKQFGDVTGYTPLRSTEPSDQDARLYSIMVPRGVEVWGGYPNYTSADDPTAFTEEVRNITGNKTYFIGEYNTEGTLATAYHVVKFTDYIFDGEGNPYTKADAAKIAANGNSTYDGNSTYGDSNLLTMEGGGVKDRGVVEGIFITGGRADAAGNTGAGINYNQYGGAAIVPEYGSIRNCILLGNEASQGGGAVYLQANAMLSGTLLKQNSADYGGAIYIERVSDEVASEQYPEEMAHITTCTVVENTANVAGGGIWFYNNTRVSSSVFWHNTCADQANVSGQTSARYGGSTQTFRQYPFAYSAVERVRLPGTNNISVASANNDGVRFTETDFYTLDDYSVLCNVGMPNVLYEDIFVKDYGVATEDFTFEPRVSEESSSYIDIGARANNAISITVPTKPEQLLLRLYVASPEDVDFDMVQKMRQCGDAVYSKIGSSFAYPMQHLEDALNYIREARKSTNPVIGSDKPLKYFAANLHFEIVMSKGTFYPLTDIYGNHGYTIANTFLIPEGVTIIGGESCTGLSDAMKAVLVANKDNREIVADGYEDDGRKQFFGQDRRAKSFYEQYSYKIDENDTGLGHATVLSDKDESEGGGSQLVKPHRVPIYDEGSGMTGVTMVSAPLGLLRSRRLMSDNNANGIYEPWEFLNQTILSGRVINATDNTDSRVYHLVTAIADETYVGELPMLDETPASKLSPGKVNSGYLSTMGSLSHEMGQPIELDGIEIQDGQAYKYINENVLDEQVYDYYHGGGIIVDGNWCSEKDAAGNVSTVYRHVSLPQTVAYRDIPLFLRNCIFSNNKAGYGGAISSNSSLNVFSCYFAQNNAESGKDTDVAYVNPSTGQSEGYTVEYPGVGGAIYTTNRLNISNTLFANNESADPTYNGDLHNFKSLRNSAQGTAPVALYGGAGGCIFGGRNSLLSIVNCDFVRNKSTLFPAIYTMNANTQDPDNLTSAQTSVTRNGYNKVLNSIFWGNEVSVKTTFANSIINHAKKGAEHTFSTSTGTPAYPNILPSSQQDFDENYSPSVWFSSYEKGTSISPKYNYDLRNCPYTIVDYIPKQLHDYATGSTDSGDLGIPEADWTDQNCNLILSSVNSDLDGPNFSSPSITAGKNGYMASSDWSISRLNNIVDNGWGRLNQIIEQKYNGDQIEYTARFTKDGDGSYSGSGAYHSIHYNADKTYDYGYKKIADCIPIGDNAIYDIYMRYLGSSMQTMFRISHDPNPTHEQTYIDMGVYEYVHTELKPTNENEVDILWVATEENLDNGEPDGSCWEQPTSDLQRAIETLLTSRNGHAKEIRITNGEYSPIYTMGDEQLLTFYINTSKLNTESTIPEGVSKDIASQSIKSLTITGGWAKDWKMTDPSECNSREYPAVLRSVERSGVSSDKMNSVFRIEDARQWYGVQTSSQNALLDPDDGNAPASVIPITIEGLTFVNDNAIEVVGQAKDEDGNLQEGAGFYYGDQVYYTTSDHKTVGSNTNADGTLISGISDAKYCTSPASGELKLRLDRSIVMASGSQNSIKVPASYIGQGGGDALVYNTLFHSNYGDPMVAYDTRVMNCTFAFNRGILRLFDMKQSNASGITNDEGTEPGGPMLAPGKRRARYALGSGSMLHNSILWRNGLGDATVEDLLETKPSWTSEAVHTAGYCNQLLYRSSSAVAPSAPLKGRQGKLEGATDEKFTYNAVSDPLYYNDTDRHEITKSEDERNNVGLSLDNSDAIYGPNFSKIEPTATTGKDMEKRDFHLLPSVRLMNTGDNDIYEAVVGTNPTETYKTIVTFKGTQPDPSGSGNNVPEKVVYSTEYTTYDKTGKIPSVRYEEKEYPWNVNVKEGTYEGYECDLASAQRVIAVTIDRGAYEFQDALTRVIYVHPGHTDGDGSSWDKPYNSLQKAIDLVAVYYNAYGEEAYVFAKEGRCNENLILRDGVRIYGSIPGTYTAMSDRNTLILTNPVKKGSSTETIVNDAWTEDNGKLQAFERKLVDERIGMAVHPTTDPGRTIINGLRNTQATYSSTTLVDGFDIHGSLSEGLTGISQPVVELSSNSGKFVVRNCIVRDNTVMGDANASLPVVDIADNTTALLYNVLLQDNKGGDNSAVLYLGDKAYAVNITNVSDGGNTVSGKGHLYNSICWNGVDGGTGIKTEVVQTNNNADADGYPFTHYVSTNGIYNDYPYITFQLDENSPHIDKAKDSDYSAGLPADLAKFIRYDTDRDIMGNPRRIATTTGIPGQGKDLVDRGCYETWRIGGEYTGANPADAAEVTAIATTKDIETVVTLAEKDENTNKTATYKSIYLLYPQAGSVVYVMPGSNLVLGEMSVSGNTVGNRLYHVGDNGYVFQPAYLLVKTGGSLYGHGCQVNLRYLAVERYYSNGTTGGLAYNHLTALPFDYDFADTRAVTYNADASNTSGKGSTLLSNTGAGAVTAANLYDYDVQDRSAWDYYFQATNSDLWSNCTATTVKAGQGVLFSPAINGGGDALLRFTTSGNYLEDYRYTESSTRWYKTLALAQNDDRTSTGGGADFTEKENMGWNLVGIPYLQGGYLTGDRSKIKDGTITAEDVLKATSHTQASDPGTLGHASQRASRYQLHVPHTLWLYYNDTDKWQSTNSWDEDDNGSAYAKATELMTGEAFFTQTSAVNESETITFSLPVWLQAPSSPNPAPGMHRVPGTRTGGMADEAEPLGGYRVYSTTGAIHVEGLTGTEHVTIHDMGGSTHASETGRRGNLVRNAQRGVYVVRIDDKPYKLTVR